MLVLKFRGAGTKIVYDDDSSLYALYKFGDDDEFRDCNMAIARHLSYVAGHGRRSTETGKPQGSRLSWRHVRTWAMEGKTRRRRWGRLFSGAGSLDSLRWRLFRVGNESKQDASIAKIHQNVPIPHAKTPRNTLAKPAVHQAQEAPVKKGILKREATTNTATVGDGLYKDIYLFDLVTIG